MNVSTNPNSIDQFEDSAKSMINAARATKNVVPLANSAKDEGRQRHWSLTLETGTLQIDLEKEGVLHKIGVGMRLTSEMHIEDGAGIVFAGHLAEGGKLIAPKSTVVIEKEGLVEGEIEAKRLYVLGTVKAPVKAHDALVVVGTVDAGENGLIEHGGIECSLNATVNGRTKKIRVA